MNSNNVKFFNFKIVFINIIFDDDDNITFDINNNNDNVLFQKYNFKINKIDVKIQYHLINCSDENNQKFVVKITTIKKM